MAVPKKRTSISKKRIRKNIWKRKGWGRAQQLHGPLPFCCFQLFPGPSHNSLLERA